MAYTFPKLAPKLAAAFAAKLTDALSYEEAMAVAEAQHAETSPNICHLHDVCDANVYMIEAYVQVTGVEPDVSEEIDCALINEAWVPGREAFLSKVLM